MDTPRIHESKLIKRSQHTSSPCHTTAATNTTTERNTEEYSFYIHGLQLSSIRNKSGSPIIRVKSPGEFTSLEEGYILVGINEISTRGLSLKQVYHILYNIKDGEEIKLLARSHKYSSDDQADGSNNNVSRRNGTLSAREKRSNGVLSAREKRMYTATCCCQSCDGCVGGQGCDCLCTIQ
mmetsp:Transcript_9272/g.11714  ORF Transcript_9272/g.11714 Transcript_9272/m.11714 type:complete len:180 (-) Transcript_9272:1357-1896(-)